MGALLSSVYKTLVVNMKTVSLHRDHLMEKATDAGDAGDIGMMVVLWRIPSVMKW